uniref:Uncharacterized protein n=1 Tax=Glossina pallidipes TaxID=7398 RepID=A0A1A9Z8M9_GLOPL
MAVVTDAYGIDSNYGGESQISCGRASKLNLYNPLASALCQTLKELIPKSKGFTPTAVSNISKWQIDADINRLTPSWRSRHVDELLDHDEVLCNLKILKLPVAPDSDGIPLFALKKCTEEIRLKNNDSSK